MTGLCYRPRSSTAFLEVVGMGEKGGEGERREGMWKKGGGETKAKLTDLVIMNSCVSVCWRRGRGTDS